MSPDLSQSDRLSRWDLLFPETRDVLLGVAALVGAQRPRRPAPWTPPARCLTLVCQVGAAECVPGSATEHDKVAGPAASVAAGPRHARGVRGSSAAHHTVVIPAVQEASDDRSSPPITHTSLARSLPRSPPSEKRMRSDALRHGPCREDPTGHQPLHNAARHPRPTCLIGRTERLAVCY